MVALYDMLVTVTVAPACVAAPFHRFAIVWAPGNVQLSVQPLIGAVPVFWMLSATWNPVPHEFVMLKPTWQVPVPVPPCVVALTRVAADDPASSTARTTKKYVVEARRPVLALDVVVSPLAICVLAEGVKLAVVLRWTVYVTEQFAGGVTAPHVRLIWLADVAAATRLVTAPGTVVHVPPVPPCVVAWAREIAVPAPSTDSTM